MQRPEDQRACTHVQPHVAERGQCHAFHQPWRSSPPVWYNKSACITVVEVIADSVSLCAGACWETLMEGFVLSEGIKEILKQKMLQKWTRGREALIAVRKDRFFPEKVPGWGFRGTVPLNDLIQVQSPCSQLSNPDSETGVQSWPHCLVSQGLQGPREVLEPFLTAERSETLTCRPGVRRDRQPPAPVTRRLVTLWEIYVWNSSEGLGCTIPPKCRDDNPQQNRSCDAKNAEFWHKFDIFSW